MVFGCFVLFQCSLVLNSEHFCENPGDPQSCRISGDCIYTADGFVGTKQKSYSPQSCKTGIFLTGTSHAYLELHSLAPNHAIISNNHKTILSSYVSLSYEGLYLKGKQNQVLLFSTNCTLINFSNHICQREDVLLYTKLHSSSPICISIKMEGGCRNFHHLSHFKAVPSIIFKLKLCHTSNNIIL